MSSIWFLPLLIVGTSVALSVPVGVYLAWLLDGHYRPPDWLRWIERRLDTGPQDWKQYAFSLLLFSTLCYIVAFVVLALQPWLPLNPDDKKMLGPSTIFHTAISFVTNNSQQHYAGEQHLSYLSQLVAIVWSMFVSGAMSACVLTAVIRGLRGDAHIGNFYVDAWRLAAYVLVPASLFLGVISMSAGVPMTFEGAALTTTREGGVTDNGDPAPQRIARGPVAALVPIKNLASVVGGFFGANSAHPFENPGPWSNFLQCVSILLLPCALIVTFGAMLDRPRHAAVIYAVMLLLLDGMTFWAVYWDTLQPNPALAGLPVDRELGNLEGKELRFGTSAGSTCASVTTAVSCGSVNCMHDSLNPLAGLTTLVGMWLNCIFGGKGVGLINFLLYLIVGVFLTGLMVGRTPEYLGKKIEAREMKLAMLALMVHPLLILAPTGLFLTLDWAEQSISNPGPHGFSQIIYEFSSASSGNGSGFEGLGDTWGFNRPEDNSTPPAPRSRHWDIAAGLVMLLSRFVPFLAALALAGGLAAKTPTPVTVGTLRTDTITFGFVLLGTILLLGALLFLPAAVLGPVAEHLGPMPFGG